MIVRQGHLPSRVIQSGFRAVISVRDKSADPRFTICLRNDSGLHARLLRCPLSLLVGPWSMMKRPVQMATRFPEYGLVSNAVAVPRACRSIPCLTPCKSVNRHEAPRGSCCLLEWNGYRCRGLLVQASLPRWPISCVDMLI